VSDAGFVRSNDRILRVQLTDEGYPRVPLTDNLGRRKKYLVHRLVAELFLERQSHQDYVLHSDGNRLNACANNLRWGTHLENHLDKLRAGTAHRGCLRKLSKTSVKAIRRSKLPARTLAAKHGISLSHAREIKSGRKWGKL
jgi:hypothetical protein